MTAAPEIGSARLRSEDARLITGQTNWTDNIQLPGMLHIAFLRSPFAHARITSVNVSAALNEPGVIAAYSGADFADEQGSLPCAWPVTPDIVIPAHPPMAVDEVRYVGEAVACVVARDRYAAADALAAIEIDYEQLPPVLDMKKALDADSPKVHETGNQSFDFVFSNGDLDAAFRDAPVVLEREYRQQRLITGQTNWTDNIRLPGMLHVAFLRSPYAHARITSVNVSAARSEPGVIAAYSGADFEIGRAHV